MLTLPVEKRGAGRAHALRNAGSIPAVVYGAHQESTPITLDARAFEKVLREAGEATIVALSGLGEPIPTLIHDVDLDPITNLPRHVDFYAVTKGQKVKVAIPLEFVGESQVVKDGANLIKVIHALEVEADPMNLPHSIEVDITALVTLEDRIHAKDLRLPAGVELAIEPEEVIALAQAVKEEVVEAAPADLSTIEVEKKGKEEEVEGEAAPAEAA